MARNDSLENISSPSYVIDYDKLKDNLTKAAFIQQESTCKILLALKAYSFYPSFELFNQYIHGSCASSLFEAKLAFENFNNNVHSYSPAFIPKDFEEITSYSSHISFNSINQKNLFFDKTKDIKWGLRVNPQHSVTNYLMYDPCAENSRLGIKADHLSLEDMTNISGFHLHSLCQQNSIPLEQIIEALEKKFSSYLQDLEWLNLGGGHLFCNDNYNVSLFCKLIKQLKTRYQLEIYVEPGEGLVQNTGYLVCTVLDIIQGESEMLAIVDTSATCHMPDVLEMPYVPTIINHKKGNYTYLIGGISCLAGDVIGKYNFKNKLEIGQKLIFGDMSQYTMVKNTFFNGINLPNIAVYQNGNIQYNKNFTYIDFKNKLS